MMPGYFFVFLVEMRFYVDQAGLQLLTSSDLPISASQSAGIIGLSHRALPRADLLRQGNCNKERIIHAERAVWETGGWRIRVLKNNLVSSGASKSGVLIGWLRDEITGSGRCSLMLNQFLGQGHRTVWQVQVEPSGC